MTFACQTSFNSLWMIPENKLCRNQKQIGQQLEALQGQKEIISNNLLHISHSLLFSRTRE